MQKIRKEKLKSAALYMILVLRAHYAKKALPCSLVFQISERQIFTENLVLGIATN